MATDPSSGPPSEAEAGYVLQCGTCGRTAPRTRDELLRHTREGWPRCCGDIMGYLTLPDAAETALDTPALGKLSDTATDQPVLPPE